MDDLGDAFPGARPARREPPRWDQPGAERPPPHRARTERSRPADVRPDRARAGRNPPERSGPTRQADERARPDGPARDADRTRSDRPARRTAPPGDGRPRRAARPDEGRADGVARPAAGPEPSGTPGGRPGSPAAGVDDATVPVPPRPPRTGRRPDPAGRAATGPREQRRPAGRDRAVESPRARPVRTAGGAAAPVRPRRGRTLAAALMTAGAATIAPGLGHLLLRRRRSGALILGAFVLGIATLLVLVLGASRSALLQNVLSTRVLIVVALACVVAAAAWIAVIVRTYVLARPRGLPQVQRLVGAGVVTLLCLTIAAPLAFAASLANSQRDLIETLFPSLGGDAAAVIAKPRLNVLLVGSDAGPDREGIRTDTMMVASLDTRTGRTVLFALPRNIGYAQFPPGSAMAEEFPRGFHDRADPSSGDYLLNAVYGFGHARPELAPPGPTDDPGLNLLHETVSHMLGLPLDYYLEVDMAGFAALIDALGGLRVDVGPERVPVGGITPSGREVRPDYYLEPGVQQLDGERALAFARSRTNSTDYVRMGRQRCLIQYILDQKSPADLLANFQGVAAATTASVSTNLPREVLPALVALAGDEEGGLALESVAFDPNLADPEEPDGRFDPGNPNFPHMREVVRDALAGPAPAPPATASAPTSAPGEDDGAGPADDRPPPTAAPQSLARSC